MLFDSDKKIEAILTSMDTKRILAKAGAYKITVDDVIEAMNVAQIMLEKMQKKIEELVYIIEELQRREDDGTLN